MRTGPALHGHLLQANSLMKDNTTVPAQHPRPLPHFTSCHTQVVGSFSRHSGSLQQALNTWQAC